MSTSFALVAVLATLPITFAGTQSQADKTVTKQNQVTVTATIKAIDQATRSITLRSENGDEDIECRACVGGREWFDGGRPVRLGR